MSCEKSAPPCSRLVGDLNNHISELKEEIRSAFSRHRQSLDSREQWLLDQADSIKDGALAVITKQEVTLAEVRGKLEECIRFMKFSKASENADGVKHASDVMAQLQKRLKECTQAQESQIPIVKFVHDKAHLRNTIISYGKLDGDAPGDDDSCTSERSWDLVETGSDGKSDRKFCCAENGSCCQKFEIDMDFPVGRSGENEMNLKYFCKANELCNSISECVCDIPCMVDLSSPEEISSNPISELHQKIGNLFSQPSKDADASSNIASGQSSTVNFQVDADPLAQISNAVQDILSFSSENENQGSPSNEIGNDFIGDLNNKLQGIIDGSILTEIPTPVTNSDHTDRVQYDTLPWSDGSSNRMTENDNFIEDLHAKIQGIIDGTIEPNLQDEQELDNASEKVQYKSLPWKEGESKNFGAGGDIVADLRQRLYGIFQGDTTGSAVEYETPWPEDPVSELSVKLSQILTA